MCNPESLHEWRWIYSFSPPNPGRCTLSDLPMSGTMPKSPLLRRPKQPPTISPLRCRTRFVLYLVHDIVHVRFFVGIYCRSFSGLFVDLGQDPATSSCQHRARPPATTKVTYSLSRKRWYSCSPTLTGEPPYCSPTSAFSSIEPKSSRGRPVSRIAYLRNEHPVASSHAHRHALSVLAEGTGADGEDLGLVELLDTRLGQEDAAGRLGLSLDTLHEHTVEEGDETLDGAERGGLPRLRVSPTVIHHQPGSV